METFCSYYNQGICSTCSRIDEAYSTQVEAKDNQLKQLLKDLGDYQHLSPIRSEPTHFRNKAKLSITGSVDSPVIGLTGEEELDLGREILNCPLHKIQINELLNILPEFITLAHLVPYQIKQKSGELKGAIIYYSSGTEEMYLRLILRSKESLDRIKKHSAFLFNHFPKLTCLTANIQPIAHAILEGEEEIFFNAQKFIQHQIGPVSMTLHPQGFVQTNQDVAQKLYSTAAEWVKEINPEKFMELFSGQGAFSFFIQKYVKNAIGVEINSEAVARANQTAAEMNWHHLSFIASDAAKVKLEVLNFKPNVILANPPRRGLDRACDILKEVQSDYFIYSSCNAQSLIKDLKILAPHFHIIKAQLFDMFPNTDHFETLVLLKSNSAYKM